MHPTQELNTVFFITLPCKLHYKTSKNAKTPPPPLIMYRNVIVCSANLLKYLPFLLFYFAYMCYLFGKFCTYYIPYILINTLINQKNYLVSEKHSIVCIRKFDHVTCPPPPHPTSKQILLYGTPRHVFAYKSEWGPNHHQGNQVTCSRLE